MEPKKTHLKSRRKYDENFKSEVLAMVAAGQPASQVVRRLGIGESLIYKWRKQAKHSADSADHAPITQVAKENELLRKELQRTIMERDILKKALSIAAGARSAKPTNRYLSDDSDISIRFLSKDAL